MDRELVVRARDGDPSAFSTLAIESHPRLFTAAFGILRDRALAEDATQQALIDTWRHIRSLRDPKRFEGWSYRILVHACYAEARRRPQWQSDAELLPGQEPRVADEFGRVHDRDQLERAFRRLSLAFTVLDETWPTPGDRRRALAIRLALDLRTWQSLDSDGLRPTEAVGLMASMIGCLDA